MSDATRKRVGSPITDLPASKRTAPAIDIVSGAASDPGKKKFYEDRHVIGGDNRLFAVFDGHGGDEVSEYLRANVVDCFNRETDRCGDMKSALTACFKALDDDVLTNVTAESGSCAVLSALEGDVVWTANIGDCRAILARKSSPEADSYRAVPLSKIHMPIYAAESARIRSAGGFVEDGRVNGRLEVSRAFGDRPFKRCGVVATPYISHFTYRSGSDGFMVLACDGLWVVMEAQAVVDFVADRIAAPREEIESDKQGDNLARNIARQLLTYAVVERYAKDNVTIIVVIFDK